MKHLTEKEFLNKIEYDNVHWSDTERINISIWYWDNSKKQMLMFTWEEYEWAEKDDNGLIISDSKGKQFYLPYHRIKEIKQYNGFYDELLWSRKK